MVRQTGIAVFTMLLVSGLWAAPPQPGTTISPFGSQIVWPSDGQLNTYANHLQNAGVQWARSELIWWGLCEQSPGVYDFNVPYGGGDWDCDNWISQMQSRGITPYIILAYGNTLYGSGAGGTPNTTSSRTAYANFCNAVVTRYKDDVDVWEIWNEPNLAQYWGATPNAADYAALVAASAPVIRAADPDCIVVGGVTSGIDLGFLQSCFNNGMLSHIDVVSVHPYRIDEPESINSEISTLRTMMNGYPNGSNVKIWTGEWGFNKAWTEYGVGAGVQESGQARMLTRMMVNNLSRGIELSIWFAVHGWDVFEDWGLTEWNNASLTRASHTAMSVLNTRLPAPVAHIIDPHGITFSPSNSANRGEVFQRGGTADTRTAALWRARNFGPGNPIASAAENVNVTFSNMPPNKEIIGFSGLTGQELALQRRSNAGAATLALENYQLWDYVDYIEVNTETLPPGARIQASSIAASATDSFLPGYDASMAYDGIVTGLSKWTSQNTSPPHWLSLSFTQPFDITGFALRLPSLAGEDYYFNAQAVEFQTGPSASGPWTPVTSASNALYRDRIIAILGAPQTAQHVRLLVTDPGIDNYARIQEFEVYANFAAGVEGWELY